MALTKPQKAQLSRYKNSGHFQTYLNGKSITKTHFESKGEDEQLQELESYIKDNNLKLTRAVKKEDTESVVADFEYLVTRIVRSNKLNSDDKIKRLEDLISMKGKDKEIQKLNKTIEDAHEKVQKIAEEKKIVEKSILKVV